MGGHGSGRPNGYGLLVDKVEDYQQIDLAWLRRQGSLSVGSGGRITWSRGGNPYAAIGYQIEAAGMRLNYRTRRRADDAWTDVHEVVPFAFTDAHYGGQRRWFVCLGCGRRCRVLYGGRYFRCRHCYGLRYETQYEPAFCRAASQAHEQRARLGQSGSLEDPFPPKPTGMHWKTYRRLKAKDKKLRARWSKGIGE